MDVCSRRGDPGSFTVHLISASISLTLNIVNCPRSFASSILNVCFWSVEFRSSVVPTCHRYFTGSWCSVGSDKDWLKHVTWIFWPSGTVLLIVVIVGFSGVPEENYIRCKIFYIFNNDTCYSYRGKSQIFQKATLLATHQENAISPKYNKHMSSYVLMYFKQNVKLILYIYKKVDR